MYPAFVLQIQIQNKHDTTNHARYVHDIYAIYTSKPNKNPNNNLTLETNQRPRKKKHKQTNQPTNQPTNQWALDRKPTRTVLTFHDSMYCLINGPRCHSKVLPQSLSENGAGTKLVLVSFQVLLAVFFFCVAFVGIQVRSC